MCIKSDFKEIVLKFVTNDRSDKMSLLTSKYVLNGGCLLLPRGYIDISNLEKMCIKSDFKEIFLKLVANDRNDKRFLLPSKFCLLGVVCP